MKDKLPFNDYFEYFGPDYKLHLPVSNMENRNTPKYLDDIRSEVILFLYIKISSFNQVGKGDANTQ
jgi:hypothetical protein